MRAAQINEYGEKDVLKMTNNAAKPQAGQGQVLVQVKAAGANPWDWKVRSGAVKDFIKLEFPATLGGDVSGVVAEVGEGVTDFQVGQEVYGQANASGGQGSFAEFTPVKASSLAPKPKSLDFVHAAALPLAATAAYQGVAELLNVQKGQKILIQGGPGGIGTYAIPLAKHLGAYVATTATAETTQYVKDLGADEVIDYKSQDFTTILKDYDAVFDLVGGETYKKSYQVMRPDGVIVSMVEQPDQALMDQYKVKAIHELAAVTTDRLNKLTELVEQGVIKPNIYKTFPLEQAADALDTLHTGKQQGKIVITV